jgi:hypothetical protein
MFTLKLYDRKGAELNIGDIVKISDHRSQFSFFCEVKFLQNEKVITPFHTFSFHSFEKIDKVPEHAIKGTEDRYNIWYLYEDEAENDTERASFDNYLMSWRECEHHLEKRSWRIELK